jgi:hypothetical protein
VFFSLPPGDRGITNDVQLGSRSTDINDSGIPIGDTLSSVCGTDGDDSETSPQRNEEATPPIPDTEATRLLRAFGVRSPATLRRHAAAQPDLIRRAEARRRELGYSAGLIGRILDDGGVIWGRCGQPVDNSAPALGEDDAGYDKYLNGPLGTYITTGLDDPLPERHAPVHAAPRGDDHELAADRGIRMPWWGEADGP